MEDFLACVWSGMAIPPQINRLARSSEKQKKAGYASGKQPMKKRGTQKKAPAGVGFRAVELLWNRLSLESTDP